MRGHDLIVKTRLAGFSPASVHIDFDTLVPNDGVHGHILIEPSDCIPLLDLRCLVGLTVFIHGEDPARVAEAAAACAHAQRVITFCGEEIEDSHAHALA